MTNVFVSCTLPDARIREHARRQHKPEEVRALIRLIQRATGPNGEVPSREQIAELIGVQPSTLAAWCTQPRGRSKTNARGIPYAAFYCLELLSASPRDTAATIWRNQ